MSTVTTRLPSLRALRARVDEVEKGASARTVSDATLIAFLAACRKVRAYARRHGLTEIDVRADGGAVSKSYRHTCMRTPMSTWVEWDGRKIYVHRGTARAVPYGETGGVYMARVRDPGHRSSGRCPKRAGYAYPLDK